MHWVQCGDSLTFNDHLCRHYQIRLVVAHYGPFVPDRKRFLALNYQAALPKFDGQGILIYFFEKPRAKRILHSEGGTENFLSKLAFD